MNLLFLLFNVFCLTPKVKTRDFEYYRSLTPYMLISYNGDNGRELVKLRFDLFYDVAPNTCRNFATILEGNETLNNVKLYYKNSIFHRIIPGFMMQGGDFTNANGTGGMSIFGEMFDDEPFIKSHKKGVLSMANRGKNTNGSQFFITFTETKFLNNKHVVFGRVKEEDMHLLSRIEKVKRFANDKPKEDVIITDCGFEKKLNNVL